MSSVLRRRRSAVALGAAAGLALTLTAWQAPGASATAHTGTHASADALPYQDASLPVGQRVADLLGRMTLAEKIGQMTQAERGSIDADTTKITTDNLGSVLSGGGSVPTPEHADGVGRHGRPLPGGGARHPARASRSSTASTPCTATATCYGATVFPHNIGLGATRDPALVRDVEHIAAARDPVERTAVGVRAVHLRGARRPLGPHLRVVRRDPGAREEDGDRDRRLPGQARPPRRQRPGAGHRQALRRRRAHDLRHRVQRQTTGDYPIDQGVDQVTHATFDRLALAPYVPAVKKHHVGSVMPSYSDVDWTEDGLGNRINMHGNRELITGWLKQQQHFKGFVISDYNGIDHIHPEAAPTTGSASGAGGGRRERRHRHVHAAAATSRPSSRP